MNQILNSLKNVGNIVSSVKTMKAEAIDSFYSPTINSRHNEVSRQFEN